MVFSLVTKDGSPAKTGLLKQIIFKKDFGLKGLIDRFFIKASYYSTKGLCIIKGINLNNIHDMFLR